MAGLSPGTPGPSSTGRTARMPRQSRTRDTVSRPCYRRRRRRLLHGRERGNEYFRDCDLFPTRARRFRRKWNRRYGRRYNGNPGSRPPSPPTPTMNLAKKLFPAMGKRTMQTEDSFNLTVVPANVAPSFVKARTRKRTPTRDRRRSKDGRRTFLGGACARIGPDARIRRFQRQSRTVLHATGDGGAQTILFTITRDGATDISGSANFTLSGTASPDTDYDDVPTISGAGAYYNAPTVSSFLRTRRPCPLSGGSGHRICNVWRLIPCRFATRADFLFPQSSHAGLALL